MTKRMLIALALLAATASLAAAGCGGDDETSATDADASGAALTEAEFIKQGNAICSAGNKELDQAVSNTFGGGEPTDEQLQQFVADTFVPSIQGQIDAIGALAPPAEITDQVDTFLSDAQDALDQVENDPALVAAGDNHGPFADVNKEATAIGLDQCAG